MNFVLQIINIILLIVAMTASLVASFRFVHMLQLESYQAKMYLKWLKKNALRDWLPSVLVFLICFFIEAALPFAIEGKDEQFLKTFSPILQTAIRIVYVLLVSNIAVVWFKQPSKKALVFTPRVKRLIVVDTIIIIIITLFQVATKSSKSTMAIYLFARCKPYLPALLLPIIVLVAHFITYPIEEGIKKSFLNQAKAKLSARTDLIKIGITGSFGKTSTKYALGTMLEQKFNTCITPQSYNTPMGVTRVAREQLSDKHEVFVAEMGARYAGDIDELCDLVSPQIGILTSVGKQHMETFGSQENITNTKFELVAALPETGAAFFNADDEICATLYKRNIAAQDKLLFGIDSKQDLYMRAIDISVSAQGSSFTLLTSDGKSVFCKTKLLGKHNILNITACAAVCYYLGLTTQQIADGIEKLQSVEHRLALVGTGAVTVIDDAFNSNPAGAKAALEVLRSFDGRKIIVTPGMVELGEGEKEQNMEFGEQIACSVDFAILVGKKRTEPIALGMAKFDFPKENIFVAASLDEATKILSNLTVAGDVVLFENDLPDNYDE